MDGSCALPDFQDIYLIRLKSYATAFQAMQQSLKSQKVCKSTLIGLLGGPMQRWVTCI